MQICTTYFLNSCWKRNRLKENHHQSPDEPSWHLRQRDAEWLETNENEVWYSNTTVAVTVAYLQFPLTKIVEGQCQSPLQTVIHLNTKSLCVSLFSHYTTLKEIFPCKYCPRVVGTSYFKEDIPVEFKIICVTMERDKVS